MFDKKEIMVKAWAIKRQDGVTMSDALKKSWALAKNPAVETELVMARVLNWTKGRMTHRVEFETKNGQKFFAVVYFGSKELWKTSDGKWAVKAEKATCLN